MIDFKFSIGEIVRLKSGGPKMTIMNFSEHFNKPNFECQWFSGSKLNSGWFPEENLIREEDFEEK